jgi:hypothetical protein
MIQLEIVLLAQLTQINAKAQGHKGAKKRRIEIEALDRRAWIWLSKSSAKDK